MNTSFLETFYWVATLKNFSEAAKRLQVSQPVVSMRMAALQRDLGATLYRGSGRSFELTNAGRRVYAKCEAIVVLSKELEDEARDAASAATTGYIGVTEVVASSWLPDFLRQLGEHPSLNVGLKTGAVTDLMSALRTGEIDVAFVLETVEDPNFVSDQICEFSVKWIASPQILPIKEHLDIQDLTRLPVIRSPRNSYRYEKLLEYFRWHDVPDLEVLQPRWIDVGLSMSTCTHLARQCVGVTAIPVAAVPGLIGDEQIAIIEIPQEFLPWRIAAIRKRAANPLIVDPVIASARRAAALFEQSADNARYFRAIE